MAPDYDMNKTDLEVFDNYSARNITKKLAMLLENVIAPVKQ